MTYSYVLVRIAIFNIYTPPNKPKSCLYLAVKVAPAHMGGQGLRGGPKGRATSSSLD